MTLVSTSVKTVLNSSEVILDMCNIFLRQDFTVRIILSVNPFCHGALGVVNFHTQFRACRTFCTWEFSKISVSSGADSTKLLPLSEIRHFGQVLRAANRLNIFTNV